MSSRDALLYFTKVYLTSLPRIINRLLLAPICAPSESLAFVHGVLNNDDIESPCPVLGSRSCAEVFPSEGDVLIKGPFHRSAPGGTWRLSELVFLAAAARFVRPRIIFEIGTFVGRTGRIFLANASDECRLYTLDLPSNRCKHIPGVDLRNTQEGERTTFLTGDSKDFDFSPWHNRCDIVFVDGCHDYKYVCTDTENALRLVAPNGWIFWHDYRHTAWWSGVTRCLCELKQSRPGLFHVMGTTIAALHNGGENYRG